MSAWVRSAEKSRVSTCLFSDRIARISIEFCTEKWGESDGQSVVSCILGKSTDGNLTVITAAKGNKFRDDSDNGMAIRDCHAEILARRAFKHWLLCEFERCIDSQHKNEEERFTSTYFDFYPVDRKLDVKKNTEFYFYVSSAPCGNACVRRWAKSSRETFQSNLPLDCAPSEPHPPFHAHAKEEGQVAVSWKKGSGCILSCSDKILRWNVLGLAGRRLRTMTKTPIYLSGIVIGRKFSRRHAERALCCRLSTTDIPLRLRQRLHHPAVMCSAEVYDKGVLSAEGAAFSSACAWWTCDGSSESICGTTGRPEHSVESTSALCRNAMHTHHDAVTSAVMTMTSASYALPSASSSAASACGCDNEVISLSNEEMIHLLLSDF